MCRAITEPPLLGSEFYYKKFHGKIRRCFAALIQLSGDQGARALLKTVSVHDIALPGQRALTDLDTPEAWAAWRAARARS
mgnify:CR=1 FL=1